MTQVKLTLDSGDPIKMDISEIRSIEEATAPDGHEYIKMVYDGDPDKKSNLYAIDGSLDKVEKTLRKAGWK